ncbi:fimbrial protein [Pseudomonas sichuanensis]|uniref:fimbrial protein n=1 Tax=Pseudomonas sichuanensis TaxID=2213015 RepID=UPI0037FBCCDD
MKPNKVIALASLLLIPCSSIAEIAFFLPENQAGAVKYSIPSTISIPQDAPVGTVLYETPLGPTGVTDNKWRCVLTCRNGLKNQVGDTAPGAAMQPIGNTGISWAWTYAYRVGGYPATSSRPGSYTLSNYYSSLQMIKTGSIVNGAVIPAGTLGFYQVEEIFPLEVQTTGTTIISMSCETPVVHVEMGDEYKPDDFQHVGSIEKRVGFSLTLNNCPPGLKKVSYTLKATGSAVSESQGIVSLNPNSTAKGVALQLFDTSDRPIPLSVPQNFSNYDSNGGNFKIRMSASYYRLPSEPLYPGTANAEVTFIMTYL